MQKQGDLPPEYSASAPHNSPGIGFNTSMPSQPAPPQGQWVVSPPPIYQQPINTHTVVVTNTSSPVTPALGNCPSCRIGNVTHEFTCCGICLAIFFFPIGILCCLCMMNRRCSHCGAALSSRKCLKFPISLLITFPVILLFSNYLGVKIKISKSTKSFNRR